MRKSELAQLLADEIGRRGLTQEQAAAELATSAPTVNRWMHGLTVPDVAAYPHLQRFLNVDDAGLARLIRQALEVRYQRKQER